MGVTVNYQWGLPNPQGIQIDEIQVAADALVAADADLKSLNDAFNAHSHSFAQITAKPTTLGGYGITDAVSSPGQKLTSANDLDSIGTGFKSGSFLGTSIPANVPPGVSYGLIVQFAASSTVNEGAQICIDRTNGKAFWRSKSGGSWSAWRQFFDQTNMGADSGLDADKLDGYQASAFALLNSSPAFGTQVKATYIDNTRYGYFGVFRQDGTRGAYFGFGNGAGTVSIVGDTATTLQLAFNTVQVGTNAVWHAGNDDSLAKQGKLNAFTVKQSFRAVTSGVAGEDAITIENPANTAQAFGFRINGNSNFSFDANYGGWQEVYLVDRQTLQVDFSGNVVSSASLSAKGGVINVWAASSAANAHLFLRNEVGTQKGLVYWNRAKNSVSLGNYGGATNRFLDLLPDGTLEIDGNVAWHAGNLDLSPYAKYYTGTNVGETNYPVGTTIIVNTTTNTYNRNAAVAIYNQGAFGNAFSDNSSDGAQLAGTWRSRGLVGSATLFERVA